MDNLAVSDIKIIKNLNNLSDSQRSQFNKVIMEGLKEKFVCALHDDTEGMIKLVNMWSELGLLPLDETFSAVDGRTGEVLSVVLLNNFKRTSNLTFMNSVVKSFGIIGVPKTLKIFFSFAALDNYNKKMEDSNIVSEIYLVATREDVRGKGIGTFLMNYVLEYNHSKYNSEASASGGKIKLLVFAKNPAKRLYERLEFRQVNSISTPDMAKSFGEDFDELLSMERLISG